MIVKNKLNVGIVEALQTFETNVISEDRKSILKMLIDYIQAKVNKSESIRLSFICTHNSRRSHLSQVWAQTMASHFNIKSVFCYSGGTEATALFPMVSETLKKTGFIITTISEGENPVYTIKYSANEHPVIGFSKTYDSYFNPESSYAAIMTCSQADKDCPFIPGAEKRISITYEDPKAFDKTPHQAEIYMERSLQIAAEMFYVFSKIQTN
ncbi:MAG: protein-tyrosine-phosphatase [Aureibaculum sp.]|nr:protein-tyrosine-phosphatase [Aureibaculum sp.]